MGRRRPGGAAVLVVALALALAAVTAWTAEPRLWVESARIEGGAGGSPGRLRIAGSIAGVSFRPGAFVRFALEDAFVKWLRPRPVRRRPEHLRVGSREHAYAFELDLRRGRFTAFEPDVRAVAGRPLRVELGGGDAVACSVVAFRREGADLVFRAATDRQLPCTVTVTPPGDGR
jgi:hypothetical protein